MYMILIRRLERVFSLKKWTNSFLFSFVFEKNAEVKKMDLKEILAKKIKEQSSTNMTKFDELLVAYLGVEPRAHYPKLKTSDGQNIKDENNRDKRSEVSDGVTYSFNELGTGTAVKVVLPQKVNLGLLDVYVVGGFGYDITGNSALKFIEKDARIARFKGEE